MLREERDRAMRQTHQFQTHYQVHTNACLIDSFMNECASTSINVLGFLKSAQDVWCTSVIASVYAVSLLIE